MTKAKEIEEVHCKFAGMIYSKFQVDAYGIRPAPPYYDEDEMDELKLKRDIINNDLADWFLRSRFDYIQETPANVWIIIHELSYDPRVFAVDTFDKTIEPIVQYIVPGNILTLTFDLPVCGKAFLY